MTVEFLYFYILRRRKSLSIFGPDALPQACPFGLLFVEIIKKESDAFKKYKKNCTIAQRSNAIFVNTDTDRIDLKRDKREEKTGEPFRNSSEGIIFMIMGIHKTDGHSKEEEDSGITQQHIRRNVSNNQYSRYININDDKDNDKYSRQHIFNEKTGDNVFIRFFGIPGKKERGHIIEAEKQ